MEPNDARTWGQQQARTSPPWPDAKWRRVAVILGVDFLPAEASRAPDADNAEDAPAHPEVAA